MTDIQNFVNEVQAKVDQAGRNLVISVMKGRKYTRIVENHAGNYRSVFCFVENATGNILKSASWATPAKGVRGNIANGASQVSAYGAAYYR